jgi:hypothetical protein
VKDTELISMTLPLDKAEGPDPEGSGPYTSGNSRGDYLKKY